jgi:hypothetical protein
MENIELRNIRPDGGTQPRTGLDLKTVADYAEEIKTGAKFPPVILFFDGSHYWLADGFHRVAAAKFAGKQRIQAEIKQGTLRDAQLHAVGANATHGLRRSREDKRRAVVMLLEDAEWGQLGNREIARYCKVSHTFVANLREETGNVASNGDGGKGGNVASNGDGGKGGNVAIDEDLTAVLRSYLEKEYKTTEPASLAVLARALSARVEHCVTIQSRLKLFKAGPYGVQAALIALAQELQSYVPQKQNAQATPDLPALLELITAIKRLTPQAADQVRQWCDGISVSSDSTAHRPVWEALENLLCALRPS